MKRRISRKLKQFSDWRKHRSTDAMVKQAEAFPESNGCQYFEPLPTDVLMVTDRYMYDYFEGSCRRLRYLSGDDNVEALLEEEHFDVFVFVSCWFGLNNDWYELNKNPKSIGKLIECLELFKKKGLPTVFYSIEDPSNFETFLPFARLCDTIFTSDRDIVERYKKETCNPNVHWMEYGVNPVLNNPIGCLREKKDAFFFAGSYPRRYKQRTDEMDHVFDAVIGAGKDLVIFDRHFNKGIGNYQFPKRFEPSVFPGVDHKILQQVHKLFRWQLNFNSITNSSTMCAMRVYELLAQGSFVLSNKSRAMVELFPEVAIHGDDSTPEDLLASIERFEAKHCLDNSRKILRSGTVFDRMREMLETAGVLSPQGIEKHPRIAVYDRDSTHRKHSLAKIEGIDLVLQTDDPKVIRDAADGDLDYVLVNSNVECMEQGTAQELLLDMLDGFKYTNSDFVTCETHRSELPGFEYTSTTSDSKPILHTIESWMKTNEKLQGDKPSTGLRLPLF